MNCNFFVDIQKDVLFYNTTFGHVEIITRLMNMISLLKVNDDILNISFNELDYLIQNKDRGIKI